MSDRSTARHASVAALTETARATGNTSFPATVTTGGSNPFVALDVGGDPVPAICLTDVPSVGMRVMVTYGQGGRIYITGVIGGIQRALGWAGTDTAQTGISTETDLVDDNGDVMEVGFEVTAPNRQIVVTGHCRLERADVLNVAAPILRAKWDDDGSPATVGILAESVGMIPDGVNWIGHGEAVFLDANYQPPDPGEYVMWLSLTAGAIPGGATSTVDTLAGASVPGSRCWLTVEDRGGFVAS